MTSDRRSVGSRWHTNREGRRSQGSKSGAVCSVASAGRIGNGSVVLQYDIHKQHNGTQWQCVQAIGWGSEVWGISRAYCMCAAAGAGNHSPCSAPSQSFNFVCSCETSETPATYGKLYMFGVLSL